MLSRRSIALTGAVTLIAAATTGATPRNDASAETVVRLISGTPGIEVPVRGVLLLLDEPMQVIQKSTPFELRSDRRLVFAAFEPAAPEAMLRLELVSGDAEPAKITAPRVMVGRRIGGVASEFVQGY